MIALIPIPAAPNEEVTHPHVSAQKLCAGEGQAAIEAALTSGRIADFFMLVDRVLHTYTEGSAFIELNALGKACAAMTAGLWSSVTSDRVATTVKTTSARTALPPVASAAAIAAAAVRGTVPAGTRFSVRMPANLRGL